MANNEDLVFGEVFSPKDEVDKDIINSHIATVMGLQLNNFLLTEERHDEYFKSIKDCTEHLLKANNNVRLYLEQEKKVMKKFKKDCLASDNKVHSTINPIELNCFTDSFLLQLKGSLDSIAKSFKPLLGVNIGGWNKVKKESGRQIIDILNNNLPVEKKNRAKTLINFIESNIKYITYIVYLRDGIHQGGTKNITGIFYNYKEKKLTSQIIFHPDNSEEILSNFLKRVIIDFSQLTSIIICLSILIAAPTGMIITKNTKEEFPPYQWHIAVENKN